MKGNPSVEDSILDVLRAALQRGLRVEIDGLGSFVPKTGGGFDFLGQALSKIFITYAHEDAWAAERLFDSLAAQGFDPWMDRRKLLPGQNWPRAIEDALSVSDFVLACFSSRSVVKRGGFQAEIRYALDCARRMPLDHVFLIPVRLDECTIPARIRNEVQYIDLFPDWEKGFAGILSVLAAQVRRSQSRPRLS